MQPATSPPPALAHDPVPTRHHPEALLDTPKAFAIALREVCLPAVRTIRPVADLAPAADALPVDPKLAGGAPATVYGVWRVLSYRPVYIVAWRDGSCQVSDVEGDDAKLAAAAREVFLAAPTPMHEVKLGAEGRPAFCEGGPSHPIIATVRQSAAKGEWRVSSTIWRWKGNEPLADCSNG